MKIIAILLGFALSLAAATVTINSAHAKDGARVSAPLAATGQVVAYGADTVCKLGCWG